MGPMFKAQAEMWSSHEGVRVKRRPGDEMPEMLGADAEAVTALVDAGAVKWVGPDGPYGPFAAGVARVKARMAEVQRRKPAPKPVEVTEDAPVSRAEFNKLMAELNAIKALGSAPAPSAPSPQKGGR